MADFFDRMGNGWGVDTDRGPEGDGREEVQKSQIKTDGDGMVAVESQLVAPSQSWTGPMADFFDRMGNGWGVDADRGREGRWPRRGAKIAKKTEGDWMVKVGQT